MVSPAALQRLKPIQDQLDTLGETQGRIRERRASWDSTTLNKVRSILSTIQQVAPLPGWTITIEGGSAFNKGVVLSMPNQLPTGDVNDRPFDNSQPIGAKLYFVPIQNGRISVIHSYPYFYGETKQANGKAVVEPDDLTPDNVCSHVADFIEQVNRWLESDRAESGRDI